MVGMLQTKRALAALKNKKISIIRKYFNAVRKPRECELTERCNIMTTIGRRYETKGFERYIAQVIEVKGSIVAPDRNPNIMYFNRHCFGYRTMPLMKV